MGHDKLRKFAENEGFSCLLQPSASDILGEGGYFALTDQPVKGHWQSMFDAERPLVVELGCGKGEYTIGLAQRNPSCNYIGVDIKGARLWKGAKYATEHNLRNVAFLRTRIEFITALFAPGEVSEIWLTFSDPQMKSENSRLSSPLFLDRYARIMKPGGKIHLKTDSQFLYRYTLAVCEANSLKIPVRTSNLYGERPAGLDPAVFEVKTFYESMFLAQGYGINYLEFIIDRPEGGSFIYPEFDAAFWREAEGPRRSFGHSPSGKTDNGAGR